MEQQKLVKNIQSITKTQTNLNDTITNGQRTQKSLHNISRLNNLSKSKISSIPQVVISYNFQNLNYGQVVRTHNLLIGLEDINEGRGNKSTFRKNVLHRVNYVSNSNEKIGKASSSIASKKNQLLRVRSNDILVGNNKNNINNDNKNIINNDLRETGIKSYHNNKQNYEQLHRFGLNSFNEENSNLDLNRVYKNNTTTMMNETAFSQNNSNKQSHQKHINNNITKIASRKSINKQKSEMNIYANSIQKVSRQKINEMNNNINYSSNKNTNDIKLSDKKVQNKLSNQNKQQQQIMEHNQFSEMGESGQRKTLRNNKQNNINNNNIDDYNQKLQRILRKVKRQHTKQSLKSAYSKKQNHSQHTTNNKTNNNNNKTNTNSIDSKNNNNQKLLNNSVGQKNQKCQQQQQYQSSQTKNNNNKETRQTKNKNNDAINIKPNNLMVQIGLQQQQQQQQQNQFNPFIPYTSASKKNISSSKKDFNKSLSDVIKRQNLQQQNQLIQKSTQQQLHQPNHNTHQQQQNFRINNIPTTLSSTTTHNNKNNHNYSNKKQPTTINELSNYHRNLIEQQNQQKKKKNYKQLIKNTNYTIIKNKPNRVSLADQFHRIDSQNQNQIGSSKKPSQQNIIQNYNKKQIKQDNPNKSIDQDIYPNQQTIQFNNRNHQNQNNHQNSKSSNKNQIYSTNLSKIQSNSNNQSNKIKEKQQTIVTDKNKNLIKQNKQPVHILRNQTKTSSITNDYNNQNNLNLSLNPITIQGRTNRQQSLTKRNRQQSLTKRKLPTDYNEFLRLLSQQNQKKRQAQDFQKQKERSLFQKNSRFKSIIDQNQHVKRIMTPIKNDFLQDRHRRLSQERKLNQRKSIQDNQQNGSIIQPSYNGSLDNRRVNKHSRHSQPNKMKSQFIQRYQRDDNRSKSMIENLDRSNLSLEKLRSTAGRAILGNEIIESQRQSQDIEQRTQRKIKQTKEEKRRNKINKGASQQQLQQEFQYSSNNNSGNQFYKSYQEKRNQKSINQRQSKAKNSNSHQNQVIGKITGMKIPAQVIQRANSRLNRKNYQKQTTNNNKKETKNKINKKDQYSSSQNKGNKKNLINNGKDKNIGLKNQSATINNKSNKKNITKNNGQNSKDQLKNNYKIQEDRKNVDKLNLLNKNHTIDKRVAKQKQRKYKNWKNSSLDEKDKIPQTHHNAKDKQINKKDWKWANKRRKNKNQGSEQSYDDSSQQEQIENESGNYQQSYNEQNNKKEKKIEKKRKLYGQNQTSQSDEDGIRNEISKKQKNQKDEIQNNDGKQRKKDQMKLINDKIEAKKELNNKISIKQKVGQKQIQPMNQSNRKQVDTKSIIQKEKDAKNMHQGPNNINRQQKQINNKESHQWSNEGSQQFSQNQQRKMAKKNENQANKNNVRDDMNNKLQVQKRTEQENITSQLSPDQTFSNQQNQKLNTTLENFMQHKNKKGDVENDQQQQQLSKQQQQQNQQMQQQSHQQKKKQVIQKVIQNQQMQQNGFMEITQSKFQIYNHQSQKSIFYQSRFNLNQNHYKNSQFNQRAQIVNYIYSLPQQYQSQIDKFKPNLQSKRLIQQQTFQKFTLQMLNNLNSLKLKKVLQEISVYDKIRSISFGPFKKNISQDNKKKNKSFLKKIFEPHQNLSQQYGVWIYCIGVWRLILVPNKQQQEQKINQSLLFQLLQKAISIALQKYYCSIKIDDIKNEQLIKMITGLRVSTLTRTNKNLPKIFKQIEYNTRKSHIIRAINNQSTDSKFSTQTINCVRKIQKTPTGQKVIQIVSYSLNANDSNNKQRYFWIKQEKFLEFFNSFTIMSKRNTESHWTNKLIEIKNQQKAVYVIESNEKHTSGSITIYPLQNVQQKTREKCTIAFYKEIQPQVLKLIGKASERLPQNKKLSHISKLYFEFNIKGTYFVFLQLQDGQYNVAIESNSSSTTMEFVEFVKKQTMRNQHAQYVEIDKIFKKKPNVETFQSSQQFKQLLNFMKKTAPEFYQAK